MEINLRNGCEVIMAHTDFESFERPAGIVLAYAKGPQRYATWNFMLAADELADCTTGHYFDDRGAAIADYHRRVETFS